MILDQREQIDQEAFDREAQELLALPLEQLSMKDNDWKKFDGPCPPSNAYVYSIQLLGDIKGKKVLDYGCGTGWLSVILAKRGGLVWGFDTSGQSIEAAKKRAVANYLEYRTAFAKMSAYKLAYEDEMFDLVIGQSILHHLDIGMAAGELVRVLKKSGRAIFAEPFGDSQALQAIRKMVPVPLNIHEGSQERQLTNQDVELLARPFSRVTYKEFQLLSRIDRVISSRRITWSLHRLDKWLLEAFPALRRYARLIVIELWK